MAEKFISFDEAVTVLRSELNYPADKANKFVSNFDFNQDGKLSLSEFEQFKTTVQKTKAQLLDDFQEYDRNGDGYVSLEEASVILTKSPFNFSAQKVALLLKRFDKDSNDKLDIQEFADFYAEAKASSSSMESIFQKLDTDCNGELSPEELLHIIMDRMGYSEPDARSFIHTFDNNQDGAIDKAEFVSMWELMFN